MIAILAKKKMVILTKSIVNGVTQYIPLGFIGGNTADDTGINVYPLRITKYGEPILRQKLKPVNYADIAPKLPKLLADMEEKQTAGRLLDVLSAVNRYHESLSLIVEKQSTQVVLLSQSCLLELIACYHDFIEKNSVDNA